MTETSFVHTPKVPKIYKVSSKIAKEVVENGASLKDLVFDDKKFKHTNTKGVYALIVTTIQHEEILNTLIRESQILLKEGGLDPWLARILMTELLWGKKKLPPSESKPIKTILEYHPVFLNTLREAVKNGTHQNELRRDPAELKPRYVRINTLKISVADALAVFYKEGWRQASPSGKDYASFLEKLANLEEDEFLQDFHIKQVFAFPPRTEFFKHQLYLDYSIILQDKATCLAPLLLNPPPGSTVLDMCAAPGLKTTQLSAIMDNTGLLYAVEKHPLRYITLCKFVSSHGATNVTTIRSDATNITPEQCQNVEYILVDPSCSGSGMNSPANQQKNMGKERIKQLAAFHVILLEKALTKFPSVKRVVYSTCSMYAEENEEVVREVLKNVNVDPERPLFKLADDPLPSWTNRGSAVFDFGRQCLYADPKTDLTIGFFIAVFEGLHPAKLQKVKKNERKLDKTVESQTEENTTRKGDTKQGVVLREDCEGVGGKKRKKNKQAGGSFAENEGIQRKKKKVENSKEYVKEMMTIPAYIREIYKNAFKSPKKEKKEKGNAPAKLTVVSAIVGTNIQKSIKSKKLKKEKRGTEVKYEADSPTIVLGDNVKKIKKQKIKNATNMIKMETVTGKTLVNGKKKPLKKKG